MELKEHVGVYDGHDFDKGFRLAFLVKALKEKGVAAAYETKCPCNMDDAAIVKLPNRVVLYADDGMAECHERLKKIAKLYPMKKFYAVVMEKGNSATLKSCMQNLRFADNISVIVEAELVDLLKRQNMQNVGTLTNVMLEFIRDFAAK